MKLILADKDTPGFPKVHYHRCAKLSERGWYIDLDLQWSNSIVAVIGRHNYDKQFHHSYIAHSYHTATADLYRCLEENDVRRIMAGATNFCGAHVKNITPGILLSRGIWQTKTIALTIAHFVVNSTYRNNPRQWSLPTHNKEGNST